MGDTFEVGRSMFCGDVVVLPATRWDRIDVLLQQLMQKRISTSYTKMCNWIISPPSMHLHTHTHACTHTRTHAHAHARTYTYTHTHTHAHTRAHAHTHAHTHTKDGYISQDPSWYPLHPWPALHPGHSPHNKHSSYRGCKWTDKHVSIYNLSAPFYSSHTLTEIGTTLVHVHVILIIQVSDVQKKHYISVAKRLIPIN